MTKLYTPPQKLFLPSDDFYYPDSSTSGKTATVNGKNLLYKQISPRRKFDKFGIDKTDYRAFALSSTVYPTAVKTTLLGELQESKPHKCGFDVVERPKEELTALSLGVDSKASSVLNAPPPTAVQSQRGPGSIQSTPVVAFVEIPLAGDIVIMPDTRATSLNSKSTANSLACSDVNERQQEDALSSSDGGIIHDPTGNKVSAVELEKGGNSELRNHHHHHLLKDGGHPKADGPHGFLARNNHGRLAMIQQKLQTESERQSWARKSSFRRQEKPKPKVVSYSRMENTRLIRYQWQSRESRTADERKDGGDIRDPLYLNTFCPEERTVRFNKISLPRLGRASRPRPWTVSESKFSNKTAQMIASRRSLPSGGVSFADKINAFNKSNPWNVKTTDALGGLPYLRKSSGGILLNGTHRGRRGDGEAGDGGAEGNPLDDDDGEEENTNGSTPLLEIRPCLTNNGNVTDQRDKLKGKEGCLNSRVKQCVRFVRYRERLDKQEENRPMKSEAGRYRPFSKTDVRDHYIDNPPPTPELKLQQSVESYHKYMENIARQTNMNSPKPFTFRGQSTASSRPNLASASSAAAVAVDADSLIVQSVMDSNRPEATPPTSQSKTGETPRPQNSAIYTKDVSAVGHVLDIKRLSPKMSTNRIVPGTRMALERPPSPTPRFPSASTDEGVEINMADTAPSSSRGDAIVVPMGTKSECPSEYSVSKDD